ncbi:MAG: hypothetical protein RML93_12345 [Anaerolineales bacterium]|nr:hypothetical protein [Anaerolineales bacterium]MDW8448064.1 hypothetical protein [Anaerolineales bacterium]
MDLYILPLSPSSEAQEQDGAAEFFLAQAAKKVARHRRNERYFIHLYLRGSQVLSPEKRTLLLRRLGELFYKTPGTTTGALRTVAESLNQFFFERNARLKNPEDQTFAFLTQIVWRGTLLTLAQSGESHVYRLTSQGVEHFYDPDLAGPGLGRSKLAKVRFVQRELRDKESLIVCVQPPLSWTLSILSSLCERSIEQFSEKLATGEGTEAWALQFRTGAGKVFHLPPLSAGSAAVDAKPSTSPAHSALEEPIPSLSGLKGEISLASPPPSTPSAQEVLAPSTSEPLPASIASVSPPPTPSPKAAAPPAVERSSHPKKSARQRSLLDEAQAQVKAIGAQLIQNLRKFLPGASVFQIPTPVMALIAILTPLVVVTLASVVYFRQGQLREFEYYLGLAEQAARQAETLSDPLAQRAAWDAALAYLSRANQYSNSSQAQALRAQANAAIDRLELVKRLDFALALEDLPKEAQITKIAVTESELFLLDAYFGVVWRAAAAARGYVLDPSASCGPGIQGATVGKLVGFGMVRKATQLQALIVGVDAQGRVITCDYNAPPLIESLTPEDRGMGNLQGFVIDRGNSYVLDPEKNAVWVYWKNQYEEEPQLFFADQVPSMEKVIDFGVYGEDLYLLYADGHVSQCVRDVSAPPRCVDPLPYRDSRPGRENQPLQIERPFTRLYISHPPEPALYLLEPTQPTIYQFSLRSLTFHAQFRPIPTPSFDALPQAVPATALAVSSEQRLAFLAFGNRVYYAYLP